MLKNVATIQIQKFATFNSDRKIINLIPNKSFRYYNQFNLRLFFDTFVYNVLNYQSSQRGGGRGCRTLKLLTFKLFSKLALDKLKM